MSLPWFRLYHEFADDPKVQMMSEAMQRRLLMLFCERCKGRKLSDTERAFHWRISEADVAETKEIFIEKGFIDEKWEVRNWDKRQFASDSSTPRVHKHRARKKQGETLHEIGGNVSETFHETRETENETAPDTDTEADTEAEGDASYAVPLPKEKRASYDASQPKNGTPKTVGRHFSSLASLKPNRPRLWAGSSPVSKARWLLEEELGVARDSKTEDMAQQVVRILAEEMGGELEAVEYLRKAALTAKADGKAINANWFLNLEYLPNDKPKLANEGSQ